MSASPYSLASTDALIESFVRTAKAARNCTRSSLVPKTVERDALI